MLFRLSTISGLVLVSLAACSEAPESCTLNVAWDPYEPYSYEAETGELAGFDIEVIRAVADQLGCGTDFVQMEWDDVLVAIEAGEADIAVGTNYYPPRAEWSWYSEPYRDEVVGLLIRREDADRFPGEDLRDIMDQGLRFGMTEGDTYAGETGITLGDFPDQVSGRVGERENINRLIGGSVDGLLIERRVGAAHLKHMELVDRATFHALKFSAKRYRFQLSKATVNTDLLARFNVALQHLKSTGKLKEISVSYDLPADNPPSSKP